MPDNLLRELKIVAAKEGMSLSGMFSRALRQIIDEEDGYAEAQRRALAALKKGYPLGTQGHPTWTRDELHER